MNDDKLLLVTGVTGYVGRCLVPRLLEEGYRVRVLARDPSRLAGLPWASQVEVEQGDTLSTDALERAMQGVSTAYYLIHNMTAGPGYLETEAISARNFAAAACQAGVSHIIYLGGLADPRDNIASHMRSRLDTGRVLREGCSQVTEFRASLIIGSGSISFEMVRYLTEQLPVIVGPMWLNNLAQPISIENVLDYLLQALENPADCGKIYEIGGKDVVTYCEAICAYARLRGLQRPMMLLPMLPARWMAYFTSRLTPVPFEITLPLIEGMRTKSLVQDDAAARDFPNVCLIDYETAVQNALKNLAPVYFESVRERAGNRPSVRREGVFIESQQLTLHADPGSLYRILCSLGGRNGWLFMNWLWQLRGWLDRLVGGPGMKGRGAGTELCEGDTVDYYHVEAARPGSLLRLKADLSAPGDGWIEWRIHPRGEHMVELTQVTYFVPHGLRGFAYWKLLRPIHLLTLNGLFRAIARKAIEMQVEQDGG